MQDHDMTDVTAVAERPLAQQLMLEVGLAAAFTAAIVAGAHLKMPLPFTPIPLTLQTLVVLLAGGLLGARLGFVATTGFLLVGLLAPGALAGPSFLGPTGGYIVGFVLAAVIMGMATRRGGWLWPIVGAVSASLVILLCGSLWLVAYTGQDWVKALQFGLLPFLPGDAIKTAAAVAGVRLFGRQMQRLLG
jgi:biotin transport system substrate-specific component